MGAALPVAGHAAYEYIRVASELAMANAVGAEAVGDPSSQPELATLEEYLPGLAAEEMHKGVP